MAFAGLKDSRKYPFPLSEPRSCPERHSYSQRSHPVDDGPKKELSIFLVIEANIYMELYYQEIHIHTYVHIYIYYTIALPLWFRSGTQEIFKLNTKSELQKVSWIYLHLGFSTQITSALID